MSTLENSKAFRYVLSKGWEHQVTDDQIKLETCPLCGKDGWKFFMNFTPEKDGVWHCFKCQEKGNLYHLREHQGDSMENVASLQDAAKARGTAEPIPDVAAFHRKLMLEAEDETVDDPLLDYLVNERGFSMAVIEKYQLGLAVDREGKRWLSIPYFQNGNVVFVKFRNMEPKPDPRFKGLNGREAPLFNQDCITRDMDELWFSEGEGDTLACISAGLETIVGVPGASLKKSAWIKMLDDMAPKKVYILYDRDRAGQAGARELANRIGLERCFNVLLPEFFIPGEEEGEEKPGKDASEWFRHGGGSLELLQELKAHAKPFNVEGVCSAADAIQELKDDLLDRGTLKAKYDSPWASLNDKLGGMEDGDVMGVLAPEKVGKSTFALNWLDYLVDHYKESGLFFCQEMQPKRVIRKWISYKTDTDDDKLNLDSIDTALGLAANYEAELLFGFTPSRKYQEVCDTIRQAHRRYGVKFVVFDNLQMLSQSMSNGAQELSIIGKAFKGLMLELNMVMILIMQPHKLKDGEMATADNISGSGAPAKDVDGLICLHRNREGRIKASDFEMVGQFECEESFSPAMLARVDLSRYGKGGTTTLTMEGARSKVIEFRAPAPLVNPFPELGTPQLIAA